MIFGGIGVINVMTVLLGTSPEIGELRVTVVVVVVFTTFFTVMPLSISGPLTAIPLLIPLVRGKVKDDPDSVSAFVVAEMGGIG